MRSYDYNERFSPTPAKSFKPYQYTPEKPTLDTFLYSDIYSPSPRARSYKEGIFRVESRRNELFDKLDRKLNSIRSNNLYSSNCGSSSNQTPFLLNKYKHNAKSEPLLKYDKLIMDSKKRKIKEDIERSIGRLSRVSKKLCYQRKQEGKKFDRDFWNRGEYYTGWKGKPKEQYQSNRARINHNDFQEVPKYSKMLRYERMLDQQLRGFGSYGLSSKGRY